MKYKLLQEYEALKKIMEEHYDEPEKLDLNLTNLSEGEIKRLSNRFVAWEKGGGVLVFYERKWYERLYKYLKDLFKMEEE